MELMYDAFISYRHLPGDMMVAEKLQTMLEKLKIKGGKKITVFRDKSDLPTSGDLGSDIQEALEHSRFLIVVCSPSYQDSKWCMAELQHFRQLHGNTNANILPILVEGEPVDSFPQLLRQEDRVVTDDAGNQRVAQVVVEPLGADVRAESARAMAKKLKTEYLRLAAPILGVSFDALYQRAQRRKRAIIAASIAALAAFAVYSSVMFAQIYIRQRQLEEKQVELLAKQRELVEKQAELYQNESIRLANEAVSLAAEDTPLAMLLVNAALPENLAKPDYPLTAEAELALRSVALQRQMEDAADIFTTKTIIPFDHTDWKIGNFYNNGKYFTVYDYNHTWLYEADTGMLIAALKGTDLYFFDGIEHYAYEIETQRENGKITQTSFAFCDTRSGREIARAELHPSKDCTGSTPVYDPGTDRLWIIGYQWDREIFDFAYFALGFFDAKGTFTEGGTLSAELEQFCIDNDVDYYLDTAYIGVGGRCFGQYNEFEPSELPEEYLAAYNDYIEYNKDAIIWAISLTSDRKVCFMQGWISPEDTERGAVLWDVEGNRVIQTLSGDYFLETDTQLVYHVTPNRLEVLAMNPQNFSISQHTPVYDYVAEDASYGMANYATNYYEDVLGTYKLSDPGDCVFVPSEYTYLPAAEQSGNVILETSLYSGLKGSLFCATPDVSRTALLSGTNRLLINDVAAEDILAWADLSEEAVCGLAINDAGTRVAYAQAADDGFVIQLIDPDALKYVGKITLTVADYEELSPSSVSSIYLEFSEEQLLVLSDELAFVYDLNDLEADPWVITLPDTDSPSPALFPCPKAFTDDGLLLLPNRVASNYGNQNGLRAAYDLTTRKELDYYTTDTWYYEDYFYDDIGGYLIQRYSNEFFIQRRGESGNFEVIYTIVPQHYDMELNVAGHACDGTWLVLQNDEYCEIYRLEDGTLCYMLRKPDDRNSQMAVIAGKLYDFCVGGNSMAIPLPTTKEAQSYIRGILTAGSNPRVLTDQELEAYYIPEEWRNKGA